MEDKRKNGMKEKQRKKERKWNERERKKTSFGR